MKLLIKHQYLVVFLLASIIFLGHYAFSRQAVYGDGIGYYAHLHSWYFDHDFDNTNEYQHIYSAENNNAQQPISTHNVQIVAVSAEGKAENHYSTGVALLLLPLYAFADIVAAVANTVGFSIPRNGYSDIYQIFVGIGAVAYTVFGLQLLARTSSFYAKDIRSAQIAIWTIFLATPLLYYGSFDVINSHFASFFLTALFFFLILTRRKNLVTLFASGIVGGLLVSTRPQDGIALAIWALIATRHVLDNKPRNTTELASATKKLFVVLVGILIAMTPLLIHVHLTFGSVFKHRYFVSFEQQSYRYTSLDLLGSLFDPTKGLFVATPLLFVVFLFYVYIRKQKRISYITPFFLFFCFQFVVITLQGGWRAEAYGARMFISSLPFFSMVLVELIRYVKKMYSLKTALALCAACILLNVVMMGNFILSRNESLLRLIHNLGR